MRLRQTVLWILLLLLALLGVLAAGQLFWPYHLFPRDNGGIDTFYGTRVPARYVAVKPAVADWRHLNIVARSSPGAAAVLAKESMP